MPPKKAAPHASKKVAKKAAKKSAKKASKKGAEKDSQHLRRAFEHLHRVHTLVTHLDEEGREHVETLGRFAQAALAAQRYRTSADLLRAAEHLAFAGLASAAEEMQLQPELKAVLREELEHLRDRAMAAWDICEPKPPKALRAILKTARGGSKDAWKDKQYDRAMELARSADALAHAAAQAVQLELKAAPEMLPSSATQQLEAGSEE